MRIDVNSAEDLENLEGFPYQYVLSLECGFLPFSQAAELEAKAETAIHQAQAASDFPVIPRLEGCPHVRGSRLRHRTERTPIESHEYRKPLRRGEHELLR